MVSSAGSSSLSYGRSPVAASLLTVSMVLMVTTTLALLQRKRNCSREILDKESDNKEDGRVLLFQSSQDDDGDDDDQGNNNKNGHHHRSTLQDEMLAAGGLLSIQPIGVVRSVYRLCVGTPRQGLLAPNARGRIDLTPSVITSGQDAVLGLNEYSHVWIFFIFHLNTLPKEQPKTSSKNGNNINVQHRRVPLKISPPALGGRKVGVLSTRSPHRPNPIGMTLARLDRIETKKKKCTGTSNGSSYKEVATTSLYISGLDLVDGTPVIDIKPYVPHYDSPCYPLSFQPLVSASDDTSTYCRLPPWVEGGLDTKRHVTFLPRALSDLQCIFQQNPNSLEFYGGKCDETAQEGLDNIKACIEQVLSIDVRSHWQSNKARNGKFQAERAHRVQQTFASMEATAGTATIASIEDDRRSTDPSVLASSDNTTEVNIVDKNDHAVNGGNSNEKKEIVETCTQQLDRLLIHYKVSVPDEMNRPSTSTGSGAEDLVQVTCIELLQTKP